MKKSYSIAFLKIFLTNPLFLLLFALMPMMIFAQSNAANEFSTEGNSRFLPLSDKVSDWNVGYVGETDSKGRPHGKGIMVWDWKYTKGNKSRYEGYFVNGDPGDGVHPGRLTTMKKEKITYDGISNYYLIRKHKSLYNIDSLYVLGEDGPTMIIYGDGEFYDGEYTQGAMSGFIVYYNPKYKRLVYGNKKAHFPMDGHFIDFRRMVVYPFNGYSFKLSEFKYSGGIHISKVPEAQEIMKKHGLVFYFYSQHEIWKEYTKKEFSQNEISKLVARHQYGKGYVRMPAFKKANTNFLDSTYVFDHFGLEMCDSILWTGNIVDGYVDGEGAGVTCEMKDGKPSYFYGTFNMGYPVGPVLYSNEGYKGDILNFGPISEGIAIVSLGSNLNQNTWDHWGLIDSNGNYITELKYKKAEPFKGGKALISQDKAGFLKDAETMQEKSAELTVDLKKLKASVDQMPGDVSYYINRFGKFVGFADGKNVERGMRIDKSKAKMFYETDCKNLLAYRTKLNSLGSSEDLFRPDFSLVDNFVGRYDYDGQDPNGFIPLAKELQKANRALELLNLGGHDPFYGTNQIDFDTFHFIKYAKESSDKHGLDTFYSTAAKIFKYVSDEISKNRIKSINKAITEFIATLEAESRAKIWGGHSSSSSSEKSSSSDNTSSDNDESDKDEATVDFDKIEFPEFKSFKNEGWLKSGANDVAVSYPYYMVIVWDDGIFGSKGSGVGNIESPDKESFFVCGPSRKKYRTLLDAEKALYVYKKYNEAIWPYGLK